MIFRNKTLLFRNKTMLFRCKTMLFLETELAKVYYGLAKVQYEQKKHSFEELCLFLIVDDRLLVLTGRRISVAAYAHLGRDTCVPRSQGRRIKLNFPSTAYLSSPHSIPLSVVLD